MKVPYLGDWIKPEVFYLICTHIFYLKPPLSKATYRACCPPRPSPILAKKSDCLFCRPPANADEMEANGRSICCSVFVSTYSKKAEPFANPVITVSATRSPYSHCEAQITYSLPQQTHIRSLLANLKHKLTYTSPWQSMQTTYCLPSGPLISHRKETINHTFKHIHLIHKMSCIPTN